MVSHRMHTKFQTSLNFGEWTANARRNMGTSLVKLCFLKCDEIQKRKTYTFIQVFVIWKFSQSIAYFYHQNLRSQKIIIHVLPLGTCGSLEPKRKEQTIKAMQFSDTQILLPSTMTNPKPVNQDRPPVTTWRAMSFLIAWSKLNLNIRICKTIHTWYLDWFISSFSLSSTFFLSGLLFQNSPIKQFSHCQAFSLSVKPISNILQNCWSPHTRTHRWEIKLVSHSHPGYKDLSGDLTAPHLQHSTSTNTQRPSFPSIWRPRTAQSAGLV